MAPYSGYPYNDTSAQLKDYRRRVRRVALQTILDRIALCRTDFWAPEDSSLKQGNELLLGALANLAHLGRASSTSPEFPIRG
ncbi:hypothetical protein FHETE_2189 [Fusarium heterosporum]|uniref:Uncharacterized protein n=1 Tax=Fusarium heterosporum TaxID=42747 RepID=A0A8H5X023_FUSHE|nr:hypothetical protein FHETE_2189 [Fusarium heterosporum]